MHSSVNVIVSEGNHSFKDEFSFPVGETHACACFILTRFSSVMDAVVKEMISADESGEVQNVVKNLLQLSVATAHQDLTSDPLSHVALCLHHRYGAVRKAAVEQLLQNTSLVSRLVSLVHKRAWGSVILCAAYFLDCTGFLFKHCYQ